MITFINSDKMAEFYWEQMRLGHWFSALFPSMFQHYWLVTGITTSS